MDIQTLTKVLWAARIEATSNRWHLERRAVPDLAKLADETGDARIRTAAQRATKAHELLDAARDDLASAIELIEEYQGLQPPQATEADNADAPRTAASNSA